MKDLSNSAEEIAREWLGAFEQALRHFKDDVLTDLFIENATWRDLVSFTWNLRQAHDRDAIESLMGSVVDEIQPHGFEIDPENPAPAPLPYGEVPKLEVFFRFETKVGVGSGIVLLQVTDTGVHAESLFTRLDSLHEVTPEWPRTDRFDEQHPGVRWRDYIEEQRLFKDREPEVLVVGGGQHGVMTAAHLARLGIDGLIIDKHPNVGDAWRTRYESLILHQPHGMLYYSFMKYPENFEEYIPKDKMADWIAAYVSSLDLNFWTSTEFISGEYNDETGVWDAVVRFGDGTTRVLHPKHIVVATGGSETANIPDLPGVADFSGSVKHSKEYKSGAEYAGKRVLVVGTGTSAHDMALDVFNNGGTPVMLQRSPVIVVGLQTANALYGDYNGRKVATELVDNRYLSGLVLPVMIRNFRGFTVAGNAADAELHAGLRAAGMTLTSEPDETGWFMRYFRTGGGYYINVGASDAIIRGDITVRQFEDANKFVPEGLELKTGEVLPFDAVLLGTGYKNQRTGLERYFGKEVADAVGDVWGFDAGGEINNGWKPTAQPGLWMMIGGIPQARWYSPVVALQIKAELEGLVPSEFKQADHITRTPELVSVG